MGLTLACHTPSNHTTRHDCEDVHISSNHYQPWSRLTSSKGLWSALGQGKWRGTWAKDNGEGGQRDRRPSLLLSRTEIWNETTRCINSFHPMFKQHHNWLSLSWEITLSNTLSVIVIGSLCSAYSWFYCPGCDPGLFEMLQLGGRKPWSSRAPALPTADDLDQVCFTFWW